MKNNLTLLLSFCIMSISFSQNSIKGNNDTSKIPGALEAALPQSKILLDEYVLTPPKIFNKMEGELNKYKNKDATTMSGVEFLQDSIFVYYFVSQTSYYMTIGKYISQNNLIIFDWDSLMTYKAINDFDFYSKYFKYKKPKPFKIIKTIYMRNSNSLTVYQYSKIELFSSPKQFFGKGFLIDSLFQIDYNSMGDKIVLKKESKKEMLFDKDSIWGYKIYQNGYCNLYRRIPKSINWNYLPGLCIAQMDSLIIYTLGGNKANCYFSKNLNSPIYRLNATGIKEAFRDNVSLLNEMTRELNKLNFFSTINDQTSSYRLVEIYRDALRKNFTQ